ncbi:MAG: D-alanine--D-alanine ligase [Hungatella sp.]|nr:D-alanine--D-alanine ligase [Hungatella sp.]
MKQTIAVLFGGQSSEHIVSCMSAVNIIEQIDKEKYQLLLIGITKEGHWLLVPSIDEVRSGSWENGQTEAILSPDATKQCVIINQNNRQEEIKVDIVFPVLHGLYGEDGTVQGLLELAKIPYVGCGVLSSAVAMDKLSTKIIVDAMGIRQADYVPIMRPELNEMPLAVKKIEEKLSYPVFVKPSNAGSSVGVNRAKDQEELKNALLEAAKHDKRILVEAAVFGHEVECAVFGGGKEEVIASGVGEILAAADFYDFESKYYNEESKTVVEPKLPGNAAEEIRQNAVAIFKAIDGYGLSRVDFFVTEEGQVVFNEINTMPGFTAISMYPMLWEARGISKKQLVEKLISHGSVRYDG